jgi:hypothetical protein
MPEAPNFANDALRNQFLRVSNQWVQAHPHGFHRENTSPTRGVENFARLCCVQTQGLLNHNMLASFNRHQCVRPMKRMRCGDVDNVEFVVVHEIVIGVVVTRNAPRECKLARSLRLPRGYTVNGATMREIDIPSDCVGNSARPDDSPAKLATAIDVDAHSGSNQEGWFREILGYC